MVIEKQRIVNELVFYTFAVCRVAVLDARVERGIVANRSSDANVRAKSGFSRD